MTTNRIGTGSSHTGLQDARARPQGGMVSRGRVGANSDQPSSDSFIASQLARLRNLIATDQIDHNARRGTYLNIVL
ncbi:MULTISPECIES: hypothetical protein [Thalassospira]|jgi:hypothetical protein|uniref:Uncharacterized protein n=1 Tax=Thalassospira indica TaxID=1891279 RepID=A0ABN5NLN3_9PROT|nr:MULTISPECIES: hypothetical protein [Thalassospira]AXO16707.1 hypothetical protein DY252_03860 [Thalassospira indica]KXJ55410.1 MAG: hypothetical protein AXW12_01280 [Thalassospira sp. Nap_22]MBP3125088.1 hypothetical protein [Thalassospira sp. ER-Se-21-Dark]OAZ14679.1 hypothetical protein TH15_02405 [Thalassospira profundimaris]